MDRRIFLIGLGAFAVSSVAFLFAGLLPLIAADTGVTIAQAGYLAAAYSMSYAIFTPVISAFTGGVNRRNFVVGALAVFVAGTVMTATSQSMSGLVLAQIVTGMAAGQFAATGQAIAISLAPAEFRARAVSIVVGGTTFAVALGAPMGSFLAHMAGWRMGFVAIGAVALICMIALWLQLPKSLPGTSLSLSERVGVLRRPGMARLILTSFIYLAGGFTVIAYLGPIVTKGVGISPDLLPLVLLIYGIGAIGGNMIGGRISDRLGARRVVLASLWIGVVASLALAGVIQFMPNWIAAPTLVVLLLIWGLVGWAYPPAQTSRLVTAAPDAAHLSLAIHVSAIYFGIAVGTFAGGRVLEAGSIAGLGVAAAAFIGISLVLVITERTPRTSSTPAIV